MGYLYTLLSILCGKIKGYCGKKTSDYVAVYQDAMFISMMRMLLCVVCGFALLALQGDVSLLAIDWKTLLISMFSGVTTSGFVVTWLISAKKSAYMMLDVFVMMGVLVTLLCSMFCYQETIRINQWLGMAMLLIAVLIMCSYNNSIKTKLNFSAVALLAASGIFSGLADFSQVMFVRSVGGSAAIFNFYTYVFAALTLLVIWLFSGGLTRSKEPGGAPLVLFKKIFFYVFIMAVCLYGNSYFKTLAAELLSSVELYPLYQGGGIILTGVMSSVFFKEKLTIKSVVGLCIAFVSLLVINLL